MANTITNLNFTILSDEVFNSYVATITPLKAFSLNVSPKPSEKGALVQALWLPLQASAATFVDDGSGYTMQDSTWESVQVQLNSHSYVSEYLTDTQITNYPQIQLEKMGHQKGFQLGKKVFQDVMAGFVYGSSAGQYPNGFASSGNLTLAKVIQLGAQADALNWPENDRHLILPPATYAQLLTDPNITKYLEYGSDEPVKEGVIPKVVGFDLYKSNILPTSVRYGIAVQSGAAAVAMRPLIISDSADYYQVDTTTNEEGFVVTMRRWYERRVGQDQVVWECIYGSAQGLPEAAIIFTS